MKNTERKRRKSKRKKRKGRWENPLELTFASTHKVVSMKKRVRGENWGLQL